MKAEHIAAETLAAFAEGSLKRAEIATILEHLETCEVCSRALDTAIDVHHAEQSDRPHARAPWWLAVAALVIVAIAAPLLWRSRPRDGIDRLVALAPRSARVVEPRLSGGFPWAAYRGPERGSTETQAARLKLAGAAGDVIEEADQRKGANDQHAAGVALVLINDPLAAIVRLEAVAAREPRDAKTWSDLAAARYAAASHLGRPALYAEALAAADRALSIDAGLAEALFNRALIVEKLGLADEARVAWKRYLEVDASSDWANEARAHLTRLGAAVGDSPFRRELPALERAAIAGDESAVRAFVARYPQQCRTFAEAEHLGRWGEAERRGDAAEAERMLRVTRAIGGALASTNSETLLRDAVHAIDAASPDARAALAEAHATYRDGRIVYSQQRPSDAEPKLRKAAELFARGSSPMALVARYFAANTRFDQDDPANARAELEPLLAESRAHTYAALAAQVQWELGLCATVDADWSAAIASLTDAAETFRRLGERNNEGFMASLLAQTYSNVGRPEEAWASWMRAFALMSAEPRGDRLPVALNVAVSTEARAGRQENARALLRVMTKSVRDSGNDPLLANALVWQTVLESESGDRDAAQRSLAEASAATMRIVDRSLRERAAANADLGAGALLLQSDARRAAAVLTRAARTYEASAAVWLPDTLLLRARALLRLGDAAGAQRDLDAGIGAVERHWLDYAGPVAGTSMLDAANALFEEAVETRLARGDAAGAFAYAERARAQFGGARGTVSVAALQQRLRGSGTAVLELVTTPSHAIAFAVREDGFAATRTPFDRARIGERSRRELYDALVRPSLASLASARALIVVPDASLQSIPFAALDDGERPLVAKMPVTMAASAASLRADAPATGGTLAVALPSGEPAGNAGLAESGGEIAEVAALHGGGRLLDPAHATFDAFVDAARGAAIIHIAGHTTQSRGDTALVFANGRRASWKSIAASRLNPEVVVLAACETLRPPAPRLRALSLAHAFAAAGAANVAGTLAPIADADARAIFGAFHRELAAGTPPAEALRRAQLEARARGNDAWADVALLTTRVPR
ncbi:MAG TPA: CHAT domain-containing protein [Thermoanaerobaculia bacterium]|jgi:tetratricopeptide (TPR) repeat protein